MIDPTLIDYDKDKGIYRLKYDAIERVEIVTNKSTKYDNGYNERPSSYMVVLKGEKRPRRVYLTPIGNVSTQYLKSKYYNVFCEVALDAALHRV